MAFAKQTLSFPMKRAILVAIIMGSMDYGIDFRFTRFSIGPYYQYTIKDFDEFGVAENFYLP